MGSMAFLLLLPAGRSRLEHLWAEDGPMFIRDAVVHEFGRNLVTPYGGYLHTVPRLVAEAASVLPLEWVPVVFAVSAAAVRTSVALVVFAASGAYLRSFPLRFAHAALVVVLPVGNTEPLNNLTNLHWFLLYGAFWALLWRSAPRLPMAVLVVFAALSGALVFLLAPLALLRLALPRRTVPVALLVGLAVQGLAMATTTRLPYSDDRYEPVDVALAALLRVPLAGLTGSEQVHRLYPAFGHWPLAVALLLTGLPVVAALRWGGPAARLVAVYGVVCGAVVITMSLSMNWVHVLSAQFPGVVMTAQRYSVLPCLFLFTAMAVGLDAASRGRSVALAAQVLLGAIVLTAAVLHVRDGAGLLRGTPWRPGLEQAREQCAAGAPEVRLDQEPDGWWLFLPCTHLRA
nr:hypothetical protein GCM10017745_39860 [Saccharothrix mutabilis subsp. capreolus]